MEPFTVSIPDSALDKLFQKLSATIFPDELEEAGRGYGAPLTDIKRLTQYWRNSYDWRKHEEKINELPNYKTPIQVDGFGTLDIHFVHQKSEAEGAIPLLFCHGCKLQQTIYLQPPLSFLEVTKLLPLLTSGGNDAPSFHVVAPSLPNFGFSSSVKKEGFGLAQYAETCHKLMQKLGYTDYGPSTPTALYFLIPIDILHSNPRRRLGHDDHPHHGPALPHPYHRLPRQPYPRCQTHPHIIPPPLPPSRPDPLQCPRKSRLRPHKLVPARRERVHLDIETSEIITNS